MVTSVHAPHLGRSVKFGRKRPVAVGPHLKLGNYLRGVELPSPPAVVDYTPKALAALNQIYLNDRYGCCVIAEAYHAQGVWTGNATGTPLIATDAQIVTDYEKIGGFDPNNPDATDNGCDMQTALNYYVQHGYADGTKLDGYVSVDATNWAEVLIGTFAFEEATIGMELPDAWVASMPTGSGFTWDAAGPPNPNYGHCIGIVGYDNTAQAARIVTWGLLGWMTRAALEKYGARSVGGELYIRVSPEQLARGQARCPNGIAWADLIRDFNQLGGHLPVPPDPAPPAPTPPAPTPPGPPAPMTLQKAEAAVSAAFAHAPFLMTRGMGVSIANNALAAAWPKS